MTQYVLTVTNWLSLENLRGLNFFKKIVAAIAYRRAVQKTIDDLSKCSDRELADMGIHRCEIKRIALEANENLRGWV
jgi:uncharacterized protein YjiS (DUF1127 family)